MWANARGSKWIRFECRPKKAAAKITNHYEYANKDDKTKGTKMRRKQDRNEGQNDRPTNSSISDMAAKFALPHTHSHKKDKITKTNNGNALDKSIKSKVKMIWVNKTREKEIEIHRIEKRKTTYFHTLVLSCIHQTKTDIAGNSYGVEVDLPSSGLCAKYINISVEMKRHVESVSTSAKMRNPIV